VARMETVQIPVPPELKDRIMAVAVAEDVSLALVGREILEAGIAKRERLSETRTLSL
jgi:hypothetical protein